MWNPQRDSDEIINEFLVGYYGGASNYVRNYIDTMKNHYLKRLWVEYFWRSPGCN